MPNPKKKITTSRDIAMRAATIVATEVDNNGNPRIPTFSMLAYDGSAMKIKGWAHRVVIDLSGVSGTTKARPIYLNHDDTQIVGHTSKIIVDKNGITATGFISGGGNAAKEVLEASRAGFPWSASVGMHPDSVERVSLGQKAVVNGRTFDGPISIARKSTLGEISFVPLGACDNTSVRVAAQHKGKSNMENEIIDNEAQDESSDFETQLERKRMMAINAACDLPAFKDIGEDSLRKIRAQAIDSGWDKARTLSELRSAGLVQLRADRPTGGPYINAGAGSENPMQAIEAAMCMTAGVSEDFCGKHFNKQAMDMATSAELRNAGPHTLMRYVIRAAGQTVPERMDNDDAIRTAFDCDRAIRAASGAGFSTLSLSGILANVQNKVMLDAYSAPEVTWTQFSSQSDNKDFKPAVRLRLTGSGAPAEVGPAGEIHNIGLTDASFTNQLKTQAGLIAITRQMLINDEAGALAQIPRILGRKIAIAVEKAVYTALLANTGSFFGGGNSNYLSGGSSALSITSLTSAEQ